MKELLEAIWQDKKCRCPSHWIWWNTDHGYQEAPHIYYTKGRVTRAYPKRKVGSYLCRNYGIAWRHQL